MNFICLITSYIMLYPFDSTGLISTKMKISLLAKKYPYICYLLYNVLNFISRKSHLLESNVGLILKVGHQGQMLKVRYIFV